MYYSFIRSAAVPLLVLSASAVCAADYQGAGIPGESPCYAVFHEHRDGQGLSLERQGPDSVPRIRDMHYSDGGTLNTRVLSVTTGPAAVLRLYNASRYRIPMFEVGPDSRVNLARPEMDSYELSCIPPGATPVDQPAPGYK